MAKPRCESLMASRATLMWRMSPALSLPSLTAEERERSLRQRGRAAQGGGAVLTLPLRSPLGTAAAGPPAQRLPPPAVAHGHVLQRARRVCGLEANRVVGGVHVDARNANVAAAVHINACWAGRGQAAVGASESRHTRTPPPTGATTPRRHPTTAPTVCVGNLPVAANRHARHRHVLAAQHVQAPIDGVCGASGWRMKGRQEGDGDHA